MEKKTVDCFVLEFVNSDGVTVKELSACPAVPEQIMAALQFLKKDCAITISYQSCECDDSGKVINLFEKL